jgi:hypothetical protein
MAIWYSWHRHAVARLHELRQEKDCGAAIPLADCATRRAIRNLTPPKVSLPPWTISRGTIALRFCRGCWAVECGVRTGSGASRRTLMPDSLCPAAGFRPVVRVDDLTVRPNADTRPSPTGLGLRATADRFSSRRPRGRLCCVRANRAWDAEDRDDCPAASGTRRCSPCSRAPQMPVPASRVLAREVRHHTLTRSRQGRPVSPALPMKRVGPHFASAVT